MLACVFDIMRPTAFDPHPQKCLAKRSMGNKTEMAYSHPWPDAPLVPPNQAKTHEFPPHVLDLSSCASNSRILSSLSLLLMPSPKLCFSLSISAVNWAIFSLCVAIVWFCCSRRDLISWRYPWMGSPEEDAGVGASGEEVLFAVLLDCFCERVWSNEYGILR